MKQFLEVVTSDRSDFVMKQMERLASRLINSCRIAKLILECSAICLNTVPVDGICQSSENSLTFLLADKRTSARGFPKAGIPYLSTTSFVGDYSTPCSSLFFKTSYEYVTLIFWVRTIGLPSMHGVTGALGQIHSRSFTKNTQYVRSALLQRVGTSHCLARNLRTFGVNNFSDLLPIFLVNFRTMLHPRS